MMMTISLPSFVCFAFWTSPSQMMAPRGTKRQLFMLLPAVVLFSIISALAFMSWRRMDGDAMYGWPITPDLPESVSVSRRHIIAQCNKTLL
ncbi:hypothetical protein BC829DRAFT_221103 [Chytridium lagenaria]|nr:hypothetical protein BC829DRAFT_221103 [Chytridium lagenaria]